MSTNRKQFLRIAAASAAALAGTASVAHGDNHVREEAYDIRKFGAVGDGTTKDTQAIQRAIDACANAGGGTVQVPAGTFLTGTIRLKSYVNLYLAPGSIILGSTERCDYPTEYGTPNREHDGREIPDWSENSGIEHLIVARNETYVSITGFGKIDGQNKVFWGQDGSGRPPIAWGTNPWRPLRSIAFVECTNVLVQGVTFLNAPGWTLWPFGCKNVTIQGITIYSKGQNTDGIDVDCSQDVRISDCHINSGDDAIALKSGTNRFGGRTVPCENINVTNCYLSSDTDAVRVGYEGDAPIRNCTFSNLTVSNTRTGLNMLVPYHPSYGVHHGPSIENILFQNIVMDVRQAIFLAVSDKAQRPGCIRNIAFSDITSVSRRASFIGGSRSLTVENIRMNNIDFIMTGEMDDSFAGEIPYPYNIWGYWQTRGLPYGFYGRYVRDLAFRGVRVKWKDVFGTWRGGFRFDEVENLDMDSVVAGPAPQAKDSPAIHLTDVSNAFIRGCRLDSEADTYLRVDGAKSSAISLVGNDLSKARNSLVADNSVPERVLFEQGNRTS